MSQIVAITPQRSTAANAALPFNIVKGRRPHAFGLLFSGRWRFDGGREVWRPRMNLVNLIPGCNGVTETGKDSKGLTQVNAGSLTDKAAKTALVRFFLSGDRRLGEFKDFQRIFHVRTTTGRVVPHFALPCEVYHRDAHGRVGRSFDHKWLDGLFSHVVKAGLIPPMDYGSFEAAMERHAREEAGLKARLLRRGSNKDALTERLDELLIRGRDMASAFDEQFPDARALWLEAERPGDDDDDGAAFDEDDDAP